MSGNVTNGSCQVTGGQGGVLGHSFEDQFAGESRRGARGKLRQINDTTRLLKLESRSGIVKNGSRQIIREQSRVFGHSFEDQLAGESRRDLNSDTGHVEAEERHRGTPEG